MNKLYLFLLCALFTTSLSAQRNYLITNVNDKPQVDGILDEAFWDSIPATDSFTTSLPAYGRVPQNATIVKMAYTTNGIYVAVTCFTPKTRKDGSKRDELGTGDYFSVGLDTWDDDQNAFVFTVTAAGQRIDQRLSSTTGGQGFDTPWNVKTNKYTNKWTAEVYIPFIALRFPVNAEQNWGLQFTRFDRTTGELSTWNPQNPLIKDIVLQYGKLEGLGIVRQKIRLGASLFTDVQNEEGFVERERYLYADSTLEQASIDGRLGINSATTLDFSIYPDSIYYDKYNTLTANSLDDIYVPNFKDLVPRPFIGEESGIWDKSSIFEHRLVLVPEMAARKIVINPGAIVYPSKLGELMNRVQFTTRTKNNIGVIVSNAIYEKNIYKIRDASFNTLRKEKSTHANVNQIAVEKCFRNNSWVQVSNIFHHVTKGFNSNKTAISTQLRNKTNQFELRSDLKIQTQARRAVAEGMLSLSKINGALVYGVGYQSPKKTHLGPLMPLGALLYPRNPHLLSAFVEKRNYSPKQKYWQNKSKSIALNSSWNSKMPVYNPLEIKSIFSGIDKKFRQLSLMVFISPLGINNSFDLGDVVINNKLKCPVGTSASITTDYRKRIVLSSNISSTLYPGTRRTGHTIDIMTSIVATRKLILECSGGADYQNNAPAPITFLPSQRHLDISNQLRYQGRFNVRILPKRSYNINLFCSSEITDFHNRSLFKITENSTLEPQDYSFTFPHKKSKFITFGGEYNWYFTRMSYFTVGIYAGEGFSNFASLSSNNEKIGDTGRHKYYIAMLCNLNRT